MNPQSTMLQRMDDHVIRWQESGDQRHVFLSCYRMMTANMLLAIEEDAFHDRQWVSKLLHHFADYYFEALTCYDCDNNVPAVWKQVHQLTVQNKLHQVQYLLIGVNAHINYDLVFALYDMLEPEWSQLPQEKQKLRYEDHCKVNEIIGATIDQVQDQILEPSNPVMAWIDAAFGRLDEYLLSRLISSWRQNVWEDTHRMLAINSTHQKEILRQTIEQNVMKKGKLLTLGK